jgi:metal-responsive CopG/Arc/MetJ family transcriptional regulator
MPTQKPTTSIVFTEVLLKRIDDYCFENRIRHRSVAVRMLLEEILEQKEKSKSENQKPKT